jgi:hypothetical protein
MSTIAARSRSGQPPALPLIGAKTLQRILLSSGVLSSLVYVLANIMCGLLWDGYSFADQTISELSAIDAPSQAAWLPFGIAYGVLLVAFMIGVWRGAAGRRGLRVTTIAFLAIAVLGAFWPPIHLRGTVTTLTDTLHVVWAAMVSALILVGVYAGRNAFGTAFRTYTIASVAGMVVFGVLTFALSPGVPKNLPTPWLGAIERVNLGFYLLWLAVLAVAMLRETRMRERRTTAKETANAA